MNKLNKKALDEFVEFNFGGKSNSESPRTMYGSLKAFKKIYPEKDYIWTKVDGGYEVISKDTNIIFYINEQIVEDEQERKD